MVGIVVVSHSRALGEAAVALAREMVPDATVRIEAAAGLDETTFGTDAVAIAEAISTTEDGDGVLVLMDIGSAILSAELALELLEDEIRQRVALSPAPLVEGLLAAAVAAAGGASLQQVATESRSGLAGKLTQLGEPRTEAPGSPASGSVVAAPAPALSAADDEVPPIVPATFTLTNVHGLHARPAARLARLAAGLDADVGIRNLTTGTDWVSARSLSQIAMLGALRGHEIEVSATGPAGQAAVDAVLALARGAFGDPLAAPDAQPLHAGSDSRRVASSAREGVVPDEVPKLLRGLPAAPGIGIGPAQLLTEQPVEIPKRATGSPTVEQHRLGDALAATAGELRTLQRRTWDQLGADEADIFEAHLALLEDPELLADVATRIASGQSAELAWGSATEDIAQSIAGLEDDYLQTRAADIRELRGRVLHSLAAPATPIEMTIGSPAEPDPAPSVLIAPDLTAAEAAGLEPTTTLAVALALGSPTSHASILIRARGIPLVVAAGPTLLMTPAGSELAVNGDTGEIQLSPDSATRTVLLDRARRQTADRAAAAQSSGRPAHTTDGLQILVGANLGSLDDALTAAESGADLAGLVRTEFLFSGRDTAPDVDEQVEVYHTLAETIGGRRLTLRTLDVGGDKPLSYAPTPAGANPFLGVRGLRLSLAHPALFRDQLRAIVRVARETPVSIMFPMVSTLTEVHAARRLLDEVIASEGHGTPAGLEVGIMVEVPAVALKAAEFAAAIDFFSIGTNDLTQYALAAERGNPDVAAIGDAYDPGLLALIRAVCQGAAGGPQVAVCGDLAGDPRAAALLVGLGVGTLSVSPPAIPLVKQAVRAVDSGQAEDLAATAIAMPGPAEVRALCFDRDEGRQ